MKNCTRIKGFKPFFNIKYNDLKIGSSVIHRNIYSVMDKKNNILPFVAKMELEVSNKITYKTKKDIENEVHIQSYVGLHGLAPKVYDFFICKHKGKQYYAILMELIEGSTLDDFIEINGSFPDKTKKAIKKQLDKLYDLGIRHDDMHGGNFLIGKKGEIMIIDFGDVKLYKNKVPKSERIYTIQINLDEYGNVTLGKEDEMTKKIKKEKLTKMKKVINEAKKLNIKNQIIGLEKQIEIYKKKKNTKMVSVYENIVKQKLDELKKM